jgi:hypothetical protein
LSAGVVRRRTAKRGWDTGRRGFETIGSAAQAERGKRGGGRRPRGGRRRWERGALHKGRQHRVAVSGPQPTGVGGGAFARTGEGGGAWPPRCESD